MKHLEMRKELISNLQSLSNWEYQKKCWILNECPNGVEYDELDYAIHFLFDDTELASDSESTIGFILKDKIEAQAVKSVCDELDKIFDKYGLDKTDEEYISLVEWKTVIESASKALKILQAENDDSS
jgi:hypothetical protein